VFDDGRVRAKVFCGHVLGLAGPVPSHSEINALTLEMHKGGVLSVDLPEDHNAFVYLLDGAVSLDAAGAVTGGHAAVLAQDGTEVTLVAEEDTRVLLMSGRPIEEDVVKHGPFVMNTHTQILEAMRDYQMGRMGILIED
jgi:redox-sensitive bicupin YhaK (pirin superfamily)